MEHFRRQYCISTAKQDAIVREHLAQVLQAENGVFVLPVESIRVKIWWQK